MVEANAIIRRWILEAPVYVISLLLFAICIALLAAKGVYPDWQGISVNAQLFFVSVVALATVDAAWQLITRRPAAPTAFLRKRYFCPKMRMIALSGLPMLALCVVLLPFFSKLKATIPLFNSYHWDSTFIAWDRVLFFGHDGWQVLQPILGYPPVTAAFGLLYQLWFLLLYPGILFFAFARIDGALRSRFFLSYILSWIVIGGAMATWLASVGPCFVGPMLGSPHFDAQMAYLHQANEQYPVMTLKVQQMLLDWHNANANGLGSGITAMPSMHVAIAFLFWLAIRRVSKGAGRFFFVFFVAIWLGSVHLAYHYAIDGLVSIIAVLAIWRSVGWLISRWSGMIMPQAYPALRTNTVPAE